MKVALCAIGRMENQYAREFVEHHLNIGFDHIIIADNNRYGEERFESVIGDLIGETVILRNYRNIENAQRLAYNELYQEYGKQYDWLAFFDFDELLCLSDGLTSVKQLIARHESSADCVMVPWMMMSDSGLIHNDCRPMMERFTERAADVPQGKCIIRGGISNLRFTRSVHIPYEPVLRCVTPAGQPTIQKRHQPNDFTVAYLKHFSTKTIEEWLRNKWPKGAAGVSYDRFCEQYRDYFFRINERTSEKEQYITNFENLQHMKEQNKTALCAIGRRENQYAQEFVEHYLSLGFDHIYMYDNNHEGEERLQDVLSCYAAEKVTIIPWSAETESAQRSAYNDCYHRFGHLYTWMAFFDFDEFLTIVSGEDIHSFMSRYNSQCVLVNWMDYTDSGLIRNDHRPLMERFTQPMPFDKQVGGDYPENNHAKSIVRTGIAGLSFKNPHIPKTPMLQCCNTKGEVCKQRPRIKYDHSIAYLRHFTTKTIEEWLTNKWLKGTAGLSYDQFRKDYGDFFFRINERTPEKEAYIQQWDNRKGRVAAVALGRMGNQMFEAAAAMTFARRTGREFVGLVYNMSEKYDFDYPKGQFNTVMRKVKYLQPEEVADFYHMTQGQYISNGFPEIREPDVVLRDYFQDNTCIDRDIALKLFKPYSEIRKEIKKLYGDLSDVVCVNVRRGDYLQVQHRGFRVLTKEQIKDMLEEHFHPQCPVLFVSDDIEWCRQNFTGDRYLFADKPCSYKPEMDLYLQTQCGAGVIIANSSFSWWGAYLNEKGAKVVCPWPWFDSPKKPKMANLLLPEWVKHGKEWKIWVTYHKDELIKEYRLDTLNDHYALYPAHHNQMNTCMSEFVTLQHVWQNQLRTDFVGFNHYRRLFNVTRLPQRGECQVLKQIRFRRGETMRDQYARCHNVKDFDLLLSLIDKRLGKDNPYSSYMRTTTTMITNVCFLMAWRDFMKMGDFVFGFLDDFSKTIECGNNPDKWHEKAVADFNETDAPYQQRLLGFLGERLVSAWIANNLKWYF